MKAEEKGIHQASEQKVVIIFQTLIKVYIYIALHLPAYHKHRSVTHLMNYQLFPTL